ncbi:acylglycerol kinase, mitochondrial [Halyomorpha halys]|uniref:acylglycerol kinase, mitochondrial n=1 Tax=Halyomorpha halys TaxID=286706 RepID=UPI0006D52332|nr:acylglycerol kinase, mitochondrial-like isoform X1 [Halyomorpha halys]
MVKLIETLRNHWKKSTLGVAVLAYGINYGLNSFELGSMMRSVCAEAVKHGDRPITEGKPRRVTVILNPASNNRKSKKNFENYCAPLLYLSGAYVSIIETEREGHGRDIIKKIDPKTDAVIVAGGDGTLSEIITGLMRYKGELCKIPIGVLPLGKTNTLAKRLYGVEDSTSYSGMVNATMAIIEGKTKTIDAFRIELLQSMEEEAKPPVYGVGGIEWGLWRHIKKQKDAFWYLGPFGKYAPLIFPGNALEKEITAKVRYTKPCSGCSECYSQRPDLMIQSPTQQQVGSRWWNVLSLKNRRLQTQGMPFVDYSKITNPECSTVEEISVKTSDLSVVTSNDPFLELDKEKPHLLLSIAPKTKYQGDLLFDGYKFLNEGKPSVGKIEMKQLEIRPETEKPEGDEENLSIDNEDFEVRPIRVTVLPNAVNVFCP